MSIAEGDTLKDFELKFEFSNVIKFLGNKSRYFLDTPRKHDILLLSSSNL